VSDLAAEADGAEPPLPIEDRVPVDDPPSSSEAPGRPTRRSSAALWTLGIIALVVTVAMVLLTAVRLPYYTISPGDAVDVTSSVSVRNKPFHAHGDVLLLFVRQRARINGWEWIRAALDPDIDLYKEQTFSGGRSPQDLETQAVADMQNSQETAKKVALERLGYKVGVAKDGLEVDAVFSDRPASGVLRKGDLIVAANGHQMHSLADLQRALHQAGVGATMHLVVRRDGKEIPREVRTVADEANHGQPVMGVYVTRPYSLPVPITIDTGNIGGPSAGLAMTLSIMDALSPADLLNGRHVAVTGEIEPNGDVAPVGGVGQKTVSARANGADAMIVPMAEVAEARKRAGHLRIIGVRNVDDALRALRELGGQPLVKPAITTGTQPR
jgi:Lon-like protease